STKAKVAEKMDKLRVADALTEIFTLFKRCNKYIDETAPWVLAKNEEDKPRLAEVLYNLTESILIGASLLASFLPETAKKIAAELGSELRSIDELDKFGLYPDGGKVIESPEILFARLDPKVILPEVEKIQAAQKAEYEAEQAMIAKNTGKAVEPVKKEDTADAGTIDVPFADEIEYGDFAKLSLRVGVIEKCEEVKKSKKLLVSQVRVGSKVLQIVSGIKKSYSPEQMVGKQVCVLVNLKPAELAGIKSEGMLLCAENAEGELALMTTDRTMPAGAEIC
ncbi:MAG: methionine--tRNA ligase subunit beta, partial [Lachnospiraceae bacterium]|nr:methionine--tRNA ligase subunit beta [Lachnospiraceae bacterium]